jgi:4-methylaminobutanoate oxidase (formaldehyde-forming)
LLRQGDKVFGVATDECEIHASWVIDAAGVWGAEIASWIGWGFAGAPTRSHYWITAPDGSGAANNPVVQLPDMRTYLRPEVGGLLVGMQEPHSKTYDPLRLIDDMGEMQLIDEESDLDLLIEQASRLRGVIPDIDRWGFAHHIAGLSMYTPDGKFLLGPVPGLSGFLIAGGCCGSGVAASGGFGQSIAELVAGIPVSIDIGHYRPDRFGVVDPSSSEFRERCAEARSQKSRGTH